MTTTGAPRYDIVIPTIGRESLTRLLGALDREHAGGSPVRVVVVDDRRGDPPALVLPTLHHLHAQVIRGRAAGPAAARDDGWRRCPAPWICFLDDDVVVGPGWRDALLADLAGIEGVDAVDAVDVAAVQARVDVPLPTDRLPTDWERNVAGLSQSRWITADLAVRRSALQAVGGFDPRFRRAYREDTDLALRLLDAGWRLTVGERRTTHPVGPAPVWASVRAQRGNADDALMRRLHGPSWRDRGGAPAGSLREHVGTVAAAGAAALALAGRRRRLAAAGAAVWAVRTARFAWRRIAPGPRTPTEAATMVLTSVAIPPAAVWWRCAGTWRARRLAPRGAADRRRAAPPALVLFDRDGTLVVDVPYNGDPALVRPVPDGRRAVERLRRAGVRVGLVTNQSGVARGLLRPEDVDAVNHRVEQLLGPFSTVHVCPHAPTSGCRCRKPQPGMVLDAAAAFGIDPSRCAVVGDIGADVDAALAAGARAVLVPTPATRREEIDAAPEVAPDLDAAIDRLLAPTRSPGGTP